MKNFLDPTIKAILVLPDGETLEAQEDLDFALDKATREHRIFLDYDEVLNMLEAIQEGKISVNGVIQRLDPDSPYRKNREQQLRAHLTRVLGVMGEPTTHPGVRKIMKEAEAFLTGKDTEEIDI